MTASSASAQSLPGLIPKPATVTPHEGTFTLTADTVIVGTEPEAKWLAESLRPATGLKLPVVERADGKGHIRLVTVATTQPSVPGSYTLDATPDGVTIQSTNTFGLFYGSQTLRQLLPPEAFAGKPTSAVTWAVPCVHIEDSPRFQWRGMMLDCSRHFFDVDFVKRYIDLLATHKMNRFHWHLTDDQGWRIEIRKYPKLTEIGSKRAGSWVFDPANPKKLKFDGVPYGGFYTQEQVRDVVAYAAARHVVVVPEIEMPGHSAAAIAAYPELGVGGQQIQVRTEWGVEEHVLNPTPETVKFYQDVLTEVMDLFPGEYIHIGGDECPKKEWDHTPAVQDRIKQLGLKDSHAMQSWFVGQMDQFLSAHGRHLIGWDEILEGGLSGGAAVMSWRGEGGAIEAARLKHEAVNASTGFAYFDYYQSQDHANEPHAIGGFLPLEKVYSFDPIPAKLPAENRRYILGGQAQLWTEYVPTTQQAEYMAYPRGCAMAERLWSTGPGDFADFRNRLAAHLKRLDAMGVNYRKLDEAK